MCAARNSPKALALTYVLPLRSQVVRDDLTGYLGSLSGICEVIVVDGSPLAVFSEHGRRWMPLGVNHVPVDRPTIMGKVGGVLTGVRLASHDKTVIADEDVRWGADQLAEVALRLDAADVVRPQNVFDPLPWHARWDTGRMLLNRSLGGDWPGTLALRRSALPPSGYRGDVLFENLELVRTVRAAGGRELVARDLFVRRLPPDISTFFDQRVRQAYDEMARPDRLLVQLSLAPALLLGGWRARAAIIAGALVAAEAGRRRGRGRTAFGAAAALWAPMWLGERAVTSWLALGSRVLRGGVRYRDTRLVTAASSMRHLRASAVAVVVS